MEQSNSEKALEQAIREAGRTLLSYWHGGQASESSLGIQAKSDGSFVTKADYASNEILVHALRSEFAHDGILSEELPMDEALANASRIWIIDPLDGTKSFIDGKDDFSVLVALTVDHLSELGYMYFPARNIFALARRSSGAWSNGVPLQVSPSTQLRSQSVYYRNFAPEAPELCYKESMDSGCAFLMLASGVFDGLIIKIVSHREWDLAAPAVVVTESGGTVTNEFGEPIRFVPGAMNCRYFVASNGRTHEELLSLIPPEDRR